MAVECCDETMVNLLLKNGARINDRTFGLTVLEKACEMNRSEIIYILLKYGADLDTWYDLDEKVSVNFAKELAKLIFEDQPVSSKNLEYMQYKHNKSLYEIFKNCERELKRMKNHDIHDGISMYDIFKMRQNDKRYILLLKNQVLVDELSLPRHLKKYHFYGEEINNNFQNTLEKTKILQFQEKIIYKSGLNKKFSLSHEVIEMIAYFANENLLF